MVPLCYRRHRFPPETIQHAIWLYLRGLLAQADEDDVASLLDDADLANAARQIRELYAAALRMPL
jgi:hypothetical protein